MAIQTQDEIEFVDDNKVCFYQSVTESINKYCDILTAEIDNIFGWEFYFELSITMTTRL